MNINAFINFNQKCPLCNNELTLYLQVRGSICCRGTKINSNYHFSKFLIEEPSISEDDKIILSSGEDCVRMIAPKSIRDLLKDQQLYLFYLCNDKGFVKEHDDYHIALFDGCYFRSSPDLVIKNNQIKYHDLEDQSINANESFVIVQIDDMKNMEKVYSVHLDYQNNITEFCFYNSSAEERKIKNFEPKMFEKKMPLLPNRPNLSLDNREKLIQKMESWIIMS